MKITCFILNIKNRQKALLSSIAESENLEITGVVDSLEMFSCKLLPIDFNPDIVVIDFNSFKANYGHFHQAWNKCRRIVITGNGKSNTGYSFDDDFGGKLEIIEIATAYKDLQTIARSIKEDKEQDKKLGWHTLTDGWIEFEMRFERRVELYWKDIFEIRRTPSFTYVSLIDKTYISQYPIKRLAMFSKKNWMAKASKDNIVNLRKIKIVNSERGEVTMTNGAIIHIKPQFYSLFWEKLTKLQKANEVARETSPCIGLEVFHINRLYPL